MQMNKSIFNPSDNAELLNRIESLSADERALWGKMDVAQMLSHCQAPLKLAIGELELNRNLLGILFGKWAKKMFLSSAPIKKNMPTVKNFQVHNFPEFEQEKTKLIAYVRRFGTEKESVLYNQVHPFFGKLTTDEWGALQWKHLDHHLSQFGK
jgi:hypothetical protein